MIKVITYGTFDLLHRGHIRLLERAKALGDYLIVGVTADDFDKTRGKINVQQSLMERVEAIRNTGIADEILIEEYEGQKIDDICKYNVDIFTVGSDWVGQFDYLDEYCKVVYLDRTQGISSSEIRAEKRQIKLGIVGEAAYLSKFYRECKYVNGISVEAAYTIKSLWINEDMDIDVCSNYNDFLNKVDAVYIHSSPSEHYLQIKQALLHGIHVMCESPLSNQDKSCAELFELAKKNGVILMDSLRTAYATAFERLTLLIKSGKIGDVISIDSVCTTLRKFKTLEEAFGWNSITAWGPTALLPVFSILGENYNNIEFITRYEDKSNHLDAFSQINLRYDNALATVKVGFGVKSENSLIITGKKGYVFVPSPWWKTDYFEVRFENANENRRYYYQLEGEGIRNELVSFVKMVEGNKNCSKIKKKTSIAIAEVVEMFEKKEHLFII